MNATNKISAYIILVVTALLTVLLWLDSHRLDAQAPLKKPRPPKVDEALLRTVGIVPDAVPEVKLNSAVGLTVSYKGRQVTAGVKLTRDVAAVIPEVVVKGGGLYTLMLVDPDAPSPTNPTARCWLHWLLVNINETGAKGRIIVPYKGPTPPIGEHRYVFLLYKQTKPISEPHWDQESHRGQFKPELYAGERSLQGPVAVMWFLTAAPTA